MESYEDRVLVVIRTCSERTVELCRTIVAQQIPAERVIAIEEKPFFNAVVKMYELGAASDADYLIGLDADLLLYPGAIPYMVEYASRTMTDQVFVINFPIICKFFGYRLGVHFYNNHHSARFLEHVAADPNAPHYLKKESDNIRRFAARHNLDIDGVRPPYALALHDYYQYHGDLFNKYTMRYERCLDNPESMKNIYELLEKRMAAHPEDMDYKVAHGGLESARQGQLDAATYLKELGLAEKEPLSAEGIQALVAEIAKKQIDPYREKRLKKMREKAQRQKR